MISVKYMGPILNTKTLHLKSRTMTCYGCIYFTKQDKCNWFYHNGKGRARFVPDDIKNKGCKQRQGIEAKGNEMIQLLINKFEGEIV